MRRLVSAMLVTFALCGHVWAQDSVAVQSKGALVLAFRLKISVPDGKGKVRQVEIAPKVVVANDKEATIRVGTPRDGDISLKVHSTLGPKGYVSLALTVTARLGGANVVRKVKLVTLLGSPAMVDIDDERRGEQLSIEVTPTRAP